MLCIANNKAIIVETAKLPLDSMAREAEALDNLRNGQPPCCNGDRLMDVLLP